MAVSAQSVGKVFDAVCRVGSAELSIRGEALGADARAGNGMTETMSQESRFPFPEFPNGWFQIANRSDLVGAGGKTKTLEKRYFGRTLRLSIDREGCLRVDLAGGEAWPVVERAGLIFVFHHAAGHAPDWQLPRLATLDQPGWTSWRTTRLEIRSHPQEICENTADVAHLAAVHGMEVGKRSAIVIETEGPMLRMGVGMMISSRPGVQKADVEIQMWTENHGPALGIVHLANPDGTETFSTYAPTPRGEGWLDYRISTALRRPGDPEEVARALEHSHHYQCATVREDIPIWENKIFRSRPRLSEADGPITRFREWYAQYYAERA